MAGTESYSESYSDSGSASSSDGAADVTGCFARCRAALRGKHRNHPKAVKRGKAAAKTVVKMVDATSITKRSMAGASAANSQSHRISLKRAAREHECKCNDKACPDVLVYARWQKKKRVAHDVADVVSVPILTASAQTAYRSTRSLYKRYMGTKGVRREEMAEDMYWGCYYGCPLGIEIVRILVGPHWAGDIQDDKGNFDAYKDIIMDSLAS